VQDRHEVLFAALTGAVFDSPGSLAPAMRRALAEGAPVPPALAPYAQKIRDHAYLTEDSDVAAIIEAGYTEDQVYELTVCAALGAGSRRMAGGLRAIVESFAVMPDAPAADPGAQPPARRIPRQAGSAAGDRVRDDRVTDDGATDENATDASAGVAP
jgi:hypothetical protein